jgi:hypothetical protein
MTVRLLSRSAGSIPAWPTLYRPPSPAHPAHSRAYAQTTIAQPLGSTRGSPPLGDPASGITLYT